MRIPAMATAAMTPTTIPAIAPPDGLELLLELSDPPVDVTVATAGVVELAAVAVDEVASVVDAEVVVVVNATVLLVTLNERIYCPEG